MDLDLEELYIDYNGYACPFTTMPCSKCELRNSYICPQCKWGREHSYVNTYHAMTLDEIENSRGIKRFSEILKEERKNKNGI